MTYGSLLWILLISAIIVYYLHSRRKSKEIGNIVMDQYVDSVTKGFFHPVDDVDRPTTIPRIGIEDFKKSMAKKYPRIGVSVYTYEVVLDCGRYDTVTLKIVDTE